MAQYDGLTNDDLYLEMTRQSLKEKEAKLERRKVAAELKRRREEESKETVKLPVSGSTKGKRSA